MKNTVLKRIGIRPIVVMYAYEVDRLGETELFEVSYRTKSKVLRLLSNINK